MTIGIYYGINYDYQYVDDPPSFVHASMKGKVMTMIDTREVDATTGLATCTLTFFKPPKGSRLIGGNLYGEASSGSGTLSVGHGATKYGRTAVSTTVPFASVDQANTTPVSANTTAFLAATNYYSAPAKTALLPIALIDTVGYEFDGETTVTVTSATNDMIDGARVTLQIDLIVA
jgi:hypothetical protein